MKAEPPEVPESVVDIKRVPKVIESVEMTKAYLIEEFTAALRRVTGRRTTVMAA